ncbi:hypothetical protein PVK06_005059 [Gossypium arboreum]|uniref:Uncharacterized protein n=1 Tax=Gossypium arboreum TaxID=29729 RepID=A0ABR0QUK2_GOSAR|nr:hypothetical protein PVK06_005059 [Gossypium arboreum]
MRYAHELFLRAVLGVIKVTTIIQVRLTAFCELNKAIDINVLISSSRKKHKTSTGVVPINPPNEKEESST